MPKVANGSQLDRRILANRGDVVEAERDFAPVGRLENLDPGDPEIFYFKKL